MSEQRQRTEIVSVRLSADELARIETIANGRPISTVLREESLKVAVQPESTGLNPHARYLPAGPGLIVDCAPGRTIEVHDRNCTARIGLRGAAAARTLAAALLHAADVAERSDPDEMEAA